MLNTPSIEFTTAPPRTVRIPGWALILLFLAYALPGNLGHAPWRGDDVLHIASTASMMRLGDWLVPRLAGVPYFDFGPLHYWLGALTGTLLGWLLPLHDAIRLATVACLAFGLWALRETAKHMLPADAGEAPSGNATLLLGLSSLGLLVHAHESQPLITLFATVSGVMWGLSQLGSAPRRAMLLTGVFTGASFLTAGLPGLVLSGVPWAVALVTRRPADSAPAVRDLVLGVAIAVALVVMWPALLAIKDGDLAAQWWQHELRDAAPRFGSGRLPALANVLSWFAWPLWPIAGWVLWLRRRQLRATAYAVPVAALVAALWVVASTGVVRPANALPLLPPLILLAGPEVGRLRKGAANLLDWFGIMTFSLVGAFLWLSWSALHVGWPQALGRNVARLTPNFMPLVAWWALPLALALSIGWAIALGAIPRFPLRGVLRWALGVTLAWGLAATLWLDWFDYDKNYASIAADISRQVQESDSPCVMGLGTGDVQRAALDYFSHIGLRDFDADDTHCTLTLAYKAGRNALEGPGAGWSMVWSRSKGQGRLQEQFALFRRD